jgi:uncharacterized protein (DUF1684 family)
MNVDRARFLAAGLVLVLLYGPGCQDSDIASPYTADIEAQRLAKDLQFFDASTTVLRPSELSRFAGLRYFPVDSTFRYDVRLERTDEPTTVLLGKQKSGPVAYNIVGTVEIVRGSDRGRLQVFRSDDMEPGTAWIPFTDATSNRTTYGGGRYLDVTILDGDSLVVDFNFAYNPLCEYNPDDFNCTIPPPSNRLPFPVTAGEKRSGLFD